MNSAMPSNLLNPLACVLRSTRHALALLLIALCGSSAAAPLRIHGSNTIGERLMPALLEGWLRSEGLTDIAWQTVALDETRLHARGRGAALEIDVHAHGSSTGFLSLNAGQADLAMSSRAVSAAEHASLGELQEQVIALDGLAVIVHPSMPLRRIDLAQLRRIFSGELSDWSAVGGRSGRIVLHARDERSGTFDTFRSLVLGSRPLAATARRYESTSELAAAVAADPRAIGFVGLAGVQGVRALAIADGAAARAPDAREVAVEDYPLARRLFLYAPARADARLRSLLAFTLSDEGQRIVEQVGFVSQRVQTFQPELADNVPADYRQLIEGAERLSLNIRFDEGSTGLDSKALADLERLAEFMRAPERQAQSLILVGFADAGETAPLLAEALSNDRADQVADRMQQIGLRPRSVRGMGGRLLLSSEDSARGRARNRRVEVWLR